MIETEFIHKFGDKKRPHRYPIKPPYCYAPVPRRASKCLRQEGHEGIHEAHGINMSIARWYAEL